MKNPIRSPIILLVFMVALIVLSTLVSLYMSQPESKEVVYADFLRKVEQGEVSGAVVNGQDLYGIYENSRIPLENVPSQYDFHTGIPGDLTEFKKDLYRIVAKDKGVSADLVTDADVGFLIRYDKPKEPSIWASILPMLLMSVLIVGCWMWFLRQQNARNSQFGKSRAAMHMDENNKVTFDQVAGMDEEREELQEIVDFLKEPKRFIDMGARIPKGVLLLGPPGTGKTLLAKATANEAGVRFFSISGSDFVEMYVGVGASRVRDLFETAKKYAPSIVFIDEIDAVGRQRGTGLGGGHDEREQTLNQLLVEMDGFTVNEGVIVMAATNRSDILDPALLRPGRFDRHITVSLPDIKGREEILKVHSKGKPLDKDVDLSIIAKRTSYFTGADLENLMNEAALLAARRGQKTISMEMLEESIWRVQAGPEKKSRVVTPKDKEKVAFHEAGHAIVAYTLPHAESVHEVSIIPRGNFGGVTLTMPDEESFFVTRNKFLDEIAVFMGGYAAELLYSGDVTTGATSDLKSATSMARNMITKYGMSEELGPIFFGSDSEEVFLGRDYGHTRNYSEKIASMIDEEMRKILENALAKAEEILRNNTRKLDRLAEMLLEREKISRSEFESLMSMA